MRKHIGITVIIIVSLAVSIEAEAQKTETTLGLYVTAKEAYDLWQADPDGIKILDVRTFAEYVCAPAYCLIKKPAGMTFEQAAAIPQAGMLAVQGLIDRAKKKLVAVLVRYSRYQ